MADILSILAQPLASKRNPNSILAAGDRINQAIGQRKDRQRQSRIDDINAERSRTQNELTDLQIQQIQSEIDRQGLTDSMINYARDLTSIQSSLSSGDVEGGRRKLLNRSSDLKKLQIDNPGISTIDTDGLIAQLERNPAQALNSINSEIDGLTRTGFLKSIGGTVFGKSSKIFKNGTVVQVGDTGLVEVKNQRGEVVKGEDAAKVLQDAYAAENEKLLSAAEVDQLQEIAQFKIDSQQSSAKGKLEIEALLTQIESGKLKIAETAENKEKAGELKGETIRILTELKNNPDGVRSFVGPFDRSIFSGPEIFPSTLKARTAHEQLTSILTVDNLKLMTGILTDTDVKILTRIAAGGLDVNGDDEAYLSEVDRMLEALSREIGAVTGGLSADEEAELLELERLDAEGKL